MGVKTKNIQTVITIPKGYSKEERRMIASDIIDYMREQATSGHNPDNGDKYPKYEKAYAKFKGVKVGDVDLTLTGKMLEAMRLIKDSDGKLVIGYKKSDEVAGKVEGNQIGSYGQPSGNPDKARPFLEINDDQKRRILRQYGVEEKEALAAIERAGVNVTQQTAEERISEESLSFIRSRVKFK